MNPVLEEIVRTGYVHTPDRGERVQLNSSISPDKGQFLQRIIRDLDARVTLETGCCFGVSGMWICDALRETGGQRHYIADPYQHEWYKGIGINNLREAGHGELVEFHEQPAHMALPRLEERGVQLDFAFIDGWHTFDYALVDFFLVDRMLKVGGVVALDDPNMIPVKKLCRYIATNRRYSVYRCFVDRVEKWFTRKERLVYHAVKRWPGLRRYFHPEMSTPHIDLGLEAGSTCIAFRKEGHDDRSWDTHADF